jgi:hypothetical protein
MFQRDQRRNECNGIRLELSDRPCIGSPFLCGPEPLGRLEYPLLSQGQNISCVTPFRCFVGGEFLR